MSKEYVIRFKGDAKQFHQALAQMLSGVTNFAEGVKNSLNTIGFDSMLNIATKLTSAARQLVTEDCTARVEVPAKRHLLGG